MRNVDVYTDGSFDGQSASWAFIAVEKDEQIYFERGSFDKSDPINKMFQVGGEIQAVKEGVKWARANDAKINIFYDYTGLYNWVADLFGGKAWRTNNAHTKRYRDFIIKNADCIGFFVKVKGHSGNKWNEEVDKLAAGARGR